MSSLPFFASLHSYFLLCLVLYASLHFHFLVGFIALICFAIFDISFWYWILWTLFCHSCCALSWWRICQSDLKAWINCLTSVRSLHFTLTIFPSDQIWNPQKWKKDDVPCSTKSNWILAQAGEFFILIIDGDIDYIDEDMDDEAHFQIWIGWISPENSNLNS